MLNPYCTTSNKFYYGKKERYIPKAVLVVMGIFSICFSIDKYQILMKEIESKECNDVLAECNNIPFNQTFVPPFYDYLQDFTISPRYDISLCLIPKVVSTIGTAAICYIQDPEAFTKNNRTISTEMYGGRFCENNELKSFKMVQRSLNSNFDNIIFTRNPYDRFISGFTEKCVNNTDTNICHGCGTDIRCFLQKEYRRLIRMSMLFPVYTGADTHFAPQTWYCDMKNNIKNSTVIQYSSTGTEKIKMIDNLLTVFKNRNVPEENLNEVREELSKGKTQHSTSGTSLRLKYEKLIEEDGAIRRALQRIYYYDFLYLGYSM
ncbi:sulfotransferase family protein [Caenorhabditis elegans]|uniref:Uncharacterized protein n=1 Tax=Caenorhabditis elegans TaxID=6239 RepID=O45177_CAEEL|nr:Uncharacterized protein CELE_K07H8.8 [Caenorhabditis elegans]CCD70606.2 Uncharacterized protein CELE_K07H8.8 [Caenorhabditis elegans]|eukprot:NP_501387.2 Uncharacterized protein CELE_K07H8.8 [Caenorhabditis elegans]